MPTRRGNCAPCGGVTPVVSQDSNSDTGDCAAAPAELHSFKRPRFFANQLLTEDDLTRLDDYIVGKQRLYNRHFHDWGVVCGLVVSCGGCGSGEVIVSSGHALTALGEDIVVAKPERIDVCTRIGSDKPDSPCPDPVNDTDEQQWLLSIHYHETLAGAGHREKCCRCGAERCKCDGRERACEPSVVCEGYRFQLTQVDRDPSGDDTKAFGFFATMIECLGPLINWAKSLGDESAGGTSDLERVLEQFQQLKWVLAEMMPAAAAKECSVEQLLNAIVVPQVVPPSDDADAVQEFQTALYQALIELMDVVVIATQACICRAALPPCRPFQPGGVPLAILTVRLDDCAVTRVCNWGERKLAHTLPNIDYWIAPALEFLKNQLATLCCTRVKVGPTAPKGGRVASKVTALPKSKAAAVDQWRSLGLDALLRALPQTVRDQVSKKEMQLVAASIAAALGDKSTPVTPASVLRPLSALALQRTQSWSRPAPKGDDKDDVATLRREVKSLRKRLLKLESK